MKKTKGNDGQQVKKYIAIEVEWFKRVKANSPTEKKTRLQKDKTKQNKENTIT